MEGSRYRWARRFSGNQSLREMPLFAQLRHWKRGVRRGRSSLHRLRQDSPSPGPKEHLLRAGMARTRIPPRRNSHGRRAHDRAADHSCPAIGAWLGAKHERGTRQPFRQLGHARRRRTRPLYQLMSHENGNLLTVSSLGSGCHWPDLTRGIVNAGGLKTRK